MSAIKDQAKATLTEFRKQFPALQNKHYLNFGAQGVMSQITLDAIQKSYLYVQEHGPLNNSMFGWIVEQGNKTKEAFAQSFGGSPSSYAITQNATEGCNIGLWSLDWRVGDKLLITNSEHNGVVAAAKQLAARRGVIVEYCDLSKATSDEQILNEVKLWLKCKPRMFMFSHVLWNTGAVLPAKEIAALCREASCISVIDGAQSAGVLPLNLEDMAADVYAFTGHKWMGGPEGIGGLYVKPESIESIKPTFVGWRSIVYDGSENPPFLEGASRFELATSPFPLMAGLVEAIRVHQSFAGAEERYKRIVDLANQLRDSIRDIPGVIFMTEEQQSSLVSFTVENHKPSLLVKQLEDQFRVIVRTIPNPYCIRASVQYFSDADIDAFSSALRQLLLAQN